MTSLAMVEVWYWLWFVSCDVILGAAVGLMKSLKDFYGLRCLSGVLKKGTVFDFNLSINRIYD